MEDQQKKQPVILAEEGKDLYKNGKFEQAAELFSQTVVIYMEEGEVLLAAEMKNNQSVALLQNKQPGLALDAVRGTSEIFKEAGDKLKWAMALANEATAGKELGNTEDAIEKFTQAADLFNNLNEQKMYLQTMQSISALKLKTRNIPGALFSMQDGLEGLEKPNLRQKFLLSLLKIPRNLINK